MAGSRRSGIGEVESDMNIHELQPSPPEVVESADEVSPPSPPTNRATKAYCKNCQKCIGDFYNSWYKVTGSYFVPAMLGSYSSTLQPMGKLKAASKGTELAGCTIQPLSCPDPACVKTAIGFTVVTAPAGKGSFRGRDFFKLGRIELQCETAPNHTIVVEPEVDASQDLLANEDTPSPPSSRATPKASSAEAMEIDSRAPSVDHPDHTRGRYEPSQDRNLQPQQQSLHPVGNNIPSLPAPSSKQSSIRNSPHAFAQDALSTAPQSNSSYRQEPPQSHQGPGIESMSGPPEVPTMVPQTNGHHYPRSPEDVSIDAMARIQTQMSHNSGALAAHTRDIRLQQEKMDQTEEALRLQYHAKFLQQNEHIKKVEALAERLQSEMQGMHLAMQNINRELYTMRMERQSGASATPHAAPSFAAQNAALEQMAQQMNVLSHKASDVDLLSTTIEIMKGKIYRLEERAGPEPSQAPPYTYQAPQASMARPPHSHQSTPTMTPSTRAPQPVTNGQPQQLSFVAPSTTATPMSAPNPTSAGPTGSQAGGWATINAGVKRTHQNGVENPQEANTQAPGSPKRQRLVDAGPSGYTASQQTPMTDHRFQTPTIPSQQTVPESVLGSQSQQSSYAPYATQDGPSDASWQPESQRMIEHRPRGRRGGGPGSRGGRVRKSMPAHGTLGTPDWERPDWQGVPDSQISPSGYYQHVPQPGRGGIARRGSGGGGGRGGYPTSDRASSLGLQGVTAAMSFGSPGDMFGSAKKTRTKPIRNADGVLIRKDGRPDMRSQSSAANLRKVHSRNEGEASHSPTGFTPTNHQYAASANAPDTPSPSGYAADPSASDKHNAIMGKMFPAGVDAARKQQDYSRQVFEENTDHTVHPRSQNHAPATKAAVQIKREQVERNRISETQSPRVQETDADMDTGEDHADDERQTPEEGGVDPEDQTEDANMQEERGTRAASHTSPEDEAAEKPRKFN
ncbi:hypothetical protein J4E86_004591 [Alternaria arbusti]|uniref:uncharacterized protein n=1 Tax=Alternaria arbusti TaxID=232088 RepID=UPI002220C616|nr:uncharacterized protein J4E86_004591 [Alternaria arbusti]KAI4957453.1 hypothetical protein J4E86_004591 [Alternaria arbusti]